MENSFLEYAYSVIYSRALPDARDGLKPVQRRILYMMSEMGLVPERGHVKSARVVGEVMSKLHPHGDSAIYDTLVRLAQPFNMRTALVDGHGNFGSLDDGPAASRYTEARLTVAAIEMVRGLHENVVDFGSNYDNSQQQPLVLPSAFPNLLVNGGGGIAVGMATNMAPHNLHEVIAATRFLMQHPDASLTEIMAYLPGPDFPTGGILTGLDGVRDAYESGRGTLRIRAKASIETLTPRRKAIVITELPYQVGPEKVVEKIKQGVQSKKLEGISDLNDFTDRKNGLKLVITVKTGFSPEAVLEQLYRQTPLEETFSINNVCLVDGQPQTLGLKKLLQVYIAHRLDVVRRRSQFRLDKCQNRLHLVSGLLLAIADIDSVITIIRGSNDSTAAKEQLQQSFELSEAQAEYILELKLRRLTKLSKIELDTEQEELAKQIAELTELLGNENMLRNTVSDELAEVAAKFGDSRRTTLLSAAATPPSKRRALDINSLQIADTACKVLLSATGMLLRVDFSAGDASAADNPPPRTQHDAIISQLATTVRSEIAILTSLGRVIKFSSVDLPSAAVNSVQLAGGAPVKQYFDSLAKDERAIALISETSAVPLAMATKNGIVKRVAPGEWPKATEFELIARAERDEIVHAAYTRAETDELVFITSDAQLLRYSAAKVRPQGRAAAGMAGIKLAAGAQVVAFNVVAHDALPDAKVLTYAPRANSAAPLFGETAFGSAKITPLQEFPPKGRATGGVRAHRFLRDENQLSGAWAGTQIAVNASDGTVREIPNAEGKRDGSGTAVTATFEAFGEQL
ncbi:DNA topoisomerase IV subunit A [Canibacter sp. lx-72]|nr:DNA topoisomerase IV subunit A [Canibacter zhuwentaonis]MBT1017982.1 DNA topoisomerase IV subunit A [Canibacter zhuwentaonis]